MTLGTKSFMYIYHLFIYNFVICNFLKNYLKGRVVTGNEGAIYVPSVESPLKWPQQPQLGQAEARWQQLHPGLTRVAWPQHLSHHLSKISVWKVELDKEIKKKTDEF